MDRTKILIVEDEAVIAMYVQNSLARLGYEVCAAVSSGEEAVKKAGEMMPDLVLMDIVLQGEMDGVQAAKIIHETLDIPVVYMTGNADVPTIQRARDIAPYGYVLKPVNVMHLFSTIDAILRRRDLEVRLAESEERFRAISENILEGVALTVDFKNVWVNDVFANIFGYTRDEMIGRGPELVVHPDDMSEVMKTGQNMLQGQETGYKRVRGVRKDGIEIILEIIGRLFKLKDETAILLIVRDITERVRIETALIESEEKYRNLVEEISDVIFAFDEKGVITFISPSIENISGFKDRELLGRNSLDLLYPEDRKRIKGSFAKRVSEGSPDHNERRIVTKSGESRWVRVSGKAVMVDGVFKGVRGVLSDIDEKKRASEALRESEERFGALVQNLQDIILVVDSDGIVKLENPATAAILGYETLGRNIFDVIHPDDIASAINDFKEVVDKVNPHTPSMFRVRHRDGSWLQVEVLATNLLNDPIVRGMLLVCRDVTMRMKARQDLMDSEERNRLLVENANEGIAVIREGRFVFVNPRLIALTGYSAEELAEKRFTELFIHPDDREMISDRYARRLGGDTAPFTYEVRFIQKSGTSRWTEVNSVLFDWEGTPAVLLFIRDITDRKQAEDERRKIESQIQQTQKLESLGVLAGGIAHDFNNLLMAILGSIDLALLDLSKTSPVRGNLIEAAKSSQRAADLCRQMLAYSGRGRFTNEPISLNELIDDMRHMLEVSVSKKAIIRYNLSRGIPAVEADATQIRQIVMNLVINASDAIGEKSGVISVSTGAMNCDRSYLSETWLDEKLPEGLYVYVEVADTGIGMSAETLPRVFDPFFTTKFAGRGLGLAAVLGIVRGHRGAVKIYSEPGKGTNFKILFPAAERPAGPLEESRHDAHGWRGSGIVILADDEETIRSIGKQMLERLGFTVRTAANGNEALDIFRELGGTVACVILDMTMPHMDGEETFREMRRIRKNARVIMSSGYNEQEITQRFVGKGLAGFIQKPYQLADLAAKLKDILE
ncbi:MAG: PAS domain S-box protein [Spirochaetes bacterium]|nr:PAS domain S-box protein [Spirochaetota bacterium]